MKISKTTPDLISNIKIHRNVKKRLGEEVYNAIEKSLPAIQNKFGVQTNITFKKLGLFKSIYEGMHDGILQGVLKPTKKLCIVVTKRIKIEKKNILGKVKQIDKKISVEYSSYAEKKDFKHLDKIIKVMTDRAAKNIEKLMQKRKFKGH